jgi:hypothetical protein
LEKQEGEVSPPRATEEEKGQAGLKGEKGGGREGGRKERRQIVEDPGMLTVPTQESFTSTHTESATTSLWPLAPISV